MLIIFCFVSLWYWDPENTTYDKRQGMGTKAMRKVHVNASICAMSDLVYPVGKVKF
jgi:hypothetical protein